MSITPIPYSLHHLFCQSFQLLRQGKLPFKYLGVPITGHESYTKAPLVNWKLICRKKKEGGLGLMDGSVWNRAAVGKLVWWLVCKADHLWVRWVDSIYIKGTDWLTYSPKPDANWYWKRICETKEMLRLGFVNGKWDDSLGEYTVAKGYWFLKGVAHNVNWQWSVWNGYAIPKHSFISWLVCHGRLLTLGRIKKWEPHVDTNCYLCQQEEETHKHLFFNCQFSKKCLMLFNGWIGIQCPVDRTLEWCTKHKADTLLQKYILVAGILGLVYEIWFVRNKCRLELNVKHPTEVLRGVKKYLRQRLKKFEGQMRNCDTSWCKLRGLG